MDLQPGQNLSLGSGRLTLELDCAPAAQRASLDLCAFLLDEGGRVHGDSGFVFYGQPRDPTGAVVVDVAAATCSIDPAMLPAGIVRVVVAVSIDAAVAGLKTFGAYQGITIDGRDATVAVRFPVATTGMAESALILVEVYQRNGVWKLRAIGQGFAGGLAPLARNYGVDVADSARPPASPASPPPAPPPAAPPVARPAPAAAPPPAPPSPQQPPQRIDLRKREPISLEKPARGFGEIRVNLNWDSGVQKRGFFGGGKGIDLDLGCMLELTQGRKAVVQALGNSFGALDEPPYAKLLGDDRSGDSTTGETLLINGQRWSEVQRALIYAFIYEGAPNWAAANAVVTVTAPGVPELVVRLDEHASGIGMCAIAMLENTGGGIRVTKLVEYFKGHEPMDRNFGFGFRWTAGRK